MHDRTHRSQSTRGVRFYGTYSFGRPGGTPGDFPVEVTQTSPWVGGGHSHVKKPGENIVFLASYAKNRGLRDCLGGPKITFFANFFMASRLESQDGGPNQVPTGPWEVALPCICQKQPLPLVPISKNHVFWPILANFYVFRAVPMEQVLSHVGPRVLVGPHG